jgi:hypothetical protein
MFHNCTKSFGAKMHHFRRFPFYPPSPLLATFSCCFLVPLLQNLTLFLLFPFCPCSSLLASLLLMFLCNYFFFNFYFLFSLLNHTKSPSSQTPKKPFNILQQVSSNFKTKNTKSSFFYKKTVTHSCKQKPEYTQTDR